MGITNYTGTPNGSYNWLINGPDDDTYENNDALATASNLGVLSGRVQTYSGLQVRDADYYRVTTTGPGTNSDFIRLNFLHSQGDIDVRLYDSGGNFLTGSFGVTDQERESPWQAGRPELTTSRCTATAGRRTPITR